MSRIRIIAAASVIAITSPSIGAQQLFGDAPPVLEMSGLPGVPDRLAYSDPTEGVCISYTPPEVLTPHPNQKLTRFLPIDPATGASVTPAAGDRFPTLVYSANFGFTQTFAAGTTSFLNLAKALEMGWQVILVGSVGPNSTPTAAQPQVCISPVVNPSPVMGEPCWDPGLWYPQSNNTTDPWYDFNYFYGEKDMAWALQYITYDSLPGNANALNVDTDCIVVSGTSGGSVYANFVAHASPEWDDNPALSPQAKTPIGVDAVVLFDPIAWSQALPPSVSTTTSPACSSHWPDAPPGNPRSRTPSPLDPLATGGVEDVLPLEGTLNTQSASRWIRENALQIPTFIADGDGWSFLSGFGRDGSTAGPAGEGEADYMRSSTSPVAMDPSFTFPDVLGGENALGIHDTWHSLNLMRDLHIADLAFHTEHSELWLRQDTPNWQRFPNYLPFMDDGSSPLAGGASFIPDVGDLLLVDGLYPADDSYLPGGYGTILPAADNLGVGRQIFRWLDKELTPGVSGRNGAPDPNPDIYRASTARLGEVLTLTIDMTGLPPEYDSVEVLGFLSPAVPPFRLNGTGPWILMNLGDPQGEQFSQDFLPRPAGDIVEFNIRIPRIPSLVGQTIYSQACIYDLCDPGVPAGTDPIDCILAGSSVPNEPLIVTNAQDFVIYDGFIPEVPFVTELHYDDDGPDSGEFVEIACVEFSNLSGYHLLIYGKDGFWQQTVPLSGIVLQQSGEWGVLAFDVPGLPDDGGGLVLLDPFGNFVPDQLRDSMDPSIILADFVSYEEDAIVIQDDPPSSGPGSLPLPLPSTLVGLKSHVIGASEPGTGSEADSIQRTSLSGILGCLAPIFQIGRVRLHIRRATSTRACRSPRFAVLVCPPLCGPFAGLQWRAVPFDVRARIADSMWGPPFGLFFRSDRVGSNVLLELWEL